MELLIGNDYYSDLILPERKKVIPGLYLLGSHLGWILSGRLPTEEKKASEVSMFLMTVNSSQQCQQSFVAPLENINDFVKPNLEEFWKLETIGIEEPINVCDDDQRQMGDTKLLGHGKKKTLISQTTTSWLLVGLTLP